MTDILEIVREKLVDIPLKVQYENQVLEGFVYYHGTLGIPTEVGFDDPLAVIHLAVPRQTPQNKEYKLFGKTLYTKPLPPKNEIVIYKLPLMDFEKTWDIVEE